MEDRYHMKINGFSFECEKSKILLYLSTFDPNRSIYIGLGYQGKVERYNTVRQAMIAIARQRSEQENS